MPRGTRGGFVTFEGIDGSGKSTALAAVARNLRAEGIDVTVTREETEGPSGDWVRTSIREGWPPEATSFLFAADRAAHLPHIEASRRAGRHVLCDRFLHSTLAYQGVTLRGRLPDPVGFLRRLHEPWCPLPDRVLLFTLDPVEAVRRAARRGATAPYEKAAFLTEVQREFLALAAADPGRFTVVDGAAPEDAVARTATDAVRSALLS